MTFSTEKKSNHNLDHSQKMSTSVKSSDETHETHGMVTKLQNIKTCTDNDILAVLYNSDRILHKFYRFYTSPTFQINYLFSCKARETRKMFIKKSNNLDEHAFLSLVGNLSRHESSFDLIHTFTHLMYASYFLMKYKHSNSIFTFLACTYINIHIFVLL